MTQSSLHSETVQMPLLPIVRDVPALRRKVGEWRAAGERVALVPTMGALHEGHLALVQGAAQHADRVVVSIFVNPSQFGPHEDFEAYPRTEQEDAGKLTAIGTDLLYAPSVDVMYPKGDVTEITVPIVSEGLCGAARPTHFAGVARVVTKLLLQVLPDIAVFGEKDYQQLQVLKRLAKDLFLSLEIQGFPTQRAEDGLALSSRNAYLTAEERQLAPLLHKSLQDLAQSLRGGAAAAPLLDAAKEALCAAGFGKIDYLELRAAEGLAPLERLSEPARLLVAAHLGKARLIDNIAV